MKNKFLYFITFIFSFLILIFSLRGNWGNPSAVDLQSKDWVENGPLELSPERGRFALTYSLYENRSIYYSLDLARFILPDLGYQEGKYVSLFAPGVSFISLPGYAIGRIFGVSQLGTYSVISLFGALNVVLISKIAGKLGVNRTVSLLSGLIYLFATPAYSYSVSLFQHQVSNFFILSGMLLSFFYTSLPGLFLLFLFYGLSLSVDYPNIVIMLPIIIYSLRRFVFKSENAEYVYLRLKLKKLFAIFGFLFPLGLLMIFNNFSNGSPLKLSGSLDAVYQIREDGSPILYKDLKEINQLTNSVKPLFNTRNMINGFYILIFSKERGVIYYAPIVIFGILYLFSVSRKNEGKISVLLSVIVINLVLYTMWGDPWGGWAFGSRYLIPSYAALSILISLMLDRFRNSKIFVFLFLVILNYSIIINTLGALTTSAIPPKSEAEALSVKNNVRSEYTYLLNLNYLLQRGTKSYIYNHYLSENTSPVKYFLVVYSAIFLFINSYAAYCFINIQGFSVKNINGAAKSVINGLGKRHTGYN